MRRAPGLQWGFSSGGRRVCVKALLRFFRKSMQDSFRGFGGFTWSSLRNK